MCLATTVVWNEKIPDATSWEDAQMTKLKVGNYVVTINGLRREIRSNISTLMFFFQHIKNGAKLPKFMVSQLCDDPSVHTPGFNYLHASKHHDFNKMHLVESWAWKNNYQELIVPNWKEVARCSSGEGSQDNSILCSLFNLPKAISWAESADKVLQRIYFLYHTACRQPASRTEEGAMLLHNLEASPQNIYWQGDWIMFQTWYHKGQNMTSHSKPCQVFFTCELSMQLHNYLAQFRPI